MIAEEPQLKQVMQVSPDEVQIIGHKLSAFLTTLPSLKYPDLAQPQTLLFVSKLSTLPTVKRGLEKLSMEHLYEWLDPTRKEQIRLAAIREGYLSEGQNPVMLFVPGLSSNPKVFYDKSHFAWTELLLSKRLAIIDELLSVMSHQVWQESVYEGKTWTFPVTSLWASMYFSQGGKLLEEHRSLCPRLIETLNQIDCINDIGTFVCNSTSTHL